MKSDEAASNPVKTWVATLNEGSYISCAKIVQPTVEVSMIDRMKREQEPEIDRTGYMPRVKRSLPADFRIIDGIIYRPAGMCTRCFGYFEVYAEMYLSLRCECLDNPMKGR